MKPRDKCQPVRRAPCLKCMVWWKDLPRHPMLDELGPLIKKWRMKCGLSLREMATVLGVSKSYLSAVEAGHHTPSMEVETRLEEVLNLPPNYLRQTLRKLWRSKQK